MTDKKALGRGLAALIPQKSDQDIETVLPGKDSGVEKWIYKGKEVVYISVDNIRPNRFQPRASFRDDKLKELTESIRQKGVLQPVLVKQLENDAFELLAGERRWRAVKQLGLDKIPAIVKETKDSDALEISLIENLQRDDLNPLEEARAYKRLADEFGFDAERISRVVGKASSSVSNSLRLLALPKKVQDAILAGHISSGHAKAILALRDPAAQEKLCARIIKTGLSVRETERIAAGTKTKRPAGEALKKDAALMALQDSLQKALGTKVRILAGKRGGRLVIDYYSNADLERIADKIIGTS
jgi:ParB family chromosome partitioning protein